MKFILKSTVLVFCFIFAGSALADKPAKDYSWSYEEERQVAGLTEQIEVGKTLDKKKYAGQKKARAPEDQTDSRPVESRPPAVRPPAPVDVSVPRSDQDTVGATPPPVVPVEDDPKPRYIPSKVDFPVTKVVAAVPEFDGSFAFLGFGLIAAFIALIRERRRTELS